MLNVDFLHGSRKRLLRAWQEEASGVYGASGDGVVGESCIQMQC